MLSGLLQLWRGPRPSSHLDDPGRRAAMSAGACLQEAASLWVAQINAARQQSKSAVGDLIDGFGQILSTLDDILGADGADHADSEAVALARLAHCEQQLDKLMARLHDMAQSRKDATATFEGLVAASSGLSGMAEDVSRLARQTNLLSINAAIEAARAGSGGRGFAVVAAEVRRLSSESGDTGQRIGAQVSNFIGSLGTAREEFGAQSSSDESAIGTSSQDITGVMADLNSVLSDANQRAASMQERSRQVKAAAESMMAALQFQDRVDQILAQVCDAISRGATQLQQSLAEGRAPDPHRWSEILHEGYTTAEQADIASAKAVVAPVKANAAAVFF